MRENVGSARGYQGGVMEGRMIKRKHRVFYARMVVMCRNIAKEARRLLPDSEIRVEKEVR